MSTQIFGASDDLIEFRGDVYGEVACYGADCEKKAVLVVCNDGTILQVWYGEAGIWRLLPLATGPLFDHIDTCSDPDADPYSDVAHFRDGLKRIYAARKWEVVS